MKHIGFALFRYFPFGGLQRDMLAIAHECANRGHRITIFTASWEGPQPEWAEVKLLPVSALSNHRRNQKFAAALQDYLKAHPVDVLAGFDKMPGLDVYYAADSCFAEKAATKKLPLYASTPRSRAFLAMEQAVFGAQSQCRILFISPPEMQVYERHYPGSNARGTLLPPGIRRDRIMPEDYEEQRAALREELGAGGQDKLLLFVGSGFRTKGLDRAIEALAVLRQSLPAAQLIVVGDDKETRYRKLARKLGVTDAVRFMGGREDVARFFWGCDVLVHPARRENTGTVLLEAMVAGLPVVASDVCGYAGWVENSGIGVVISESETAINLSRSIANILSAPSKNWLTLSRKFSASEDVYSLVFHAARKIELSGTN